MIFTVALIFFSLVALLGLTAVLLLRPLRAEADFRAFDASQMELLAAGHFVNCKQVSRALAHEDLALVQARLSRLSSKRMRTERHSLVRAYIVELGRDFARIDRLARIVASLSPEIDRRQELERLRLEVRFRYLYRLVLLRLTVGGNLPAEALVRLANLVGAFARRVETAMTLTGNPTLGEQTLSA